MAARQPAFSFLPLTPCHAATLAPLHARALPPGWSEASFKALLESDAYGFAMEKDGEMAGFILCRISVDEAELLTFAVADDYRRQGIGKDLLGVSMDHARQHGAERMFLEVAADNVAAIALYKNAGFEEVARRNAYYRSGADAVVMRRNF